MIFFKLITLCFLFTLDLYELWLSFSPFTEFQLIHNGTSTPY